jgi:hypothetical protein
MRICRLICSIGGVQRLVGETLSSILPDVAALRIRTCQKSVCVSGGMSIHRFDGSNWVQREHSM